MKTILAMFAISAAVIVAAAPALAHSGGHGDLSFFVGILHFLSQPDHWLGVLFAVVFVGAVVVWRSRFSR